MAYYLGREVVVALTTEDVALGVDVTAAGVLDTFTGTVGPGAATDAVFAGNRAVHNVANTPSSSWSASKTIFGTQDADRDFTNEIADLTSVDIGIGTSDEDITYFGQRTTLKTEIKKETTLSITRKKNNESWDVVFNEARHGVESSNKFFGYGTVGHVNPGRADYGYRVFLKLNSDGQVITLPNCCITGHTISLNADGTTEETMEFMCYLAPTITAGTVDTETDHVAAETVF